MPISRPWATTSRPTGRVTPPSKLSKNVSENASTPNQWVPHQYQKKAVKWLVQHPAAALFLDLGLGKTAIALEAFQALRRAGGAHKALVLSPRRPAQLVWTDRDGGEVGKWAQFQGLRVALLHGDDKDEALETDADLYVLNYDGLPWFTKVKGWQRLFKRGVDVFIADELSKLKHAKTQRFKLVKPWLGKFRRRWGLTGSPASRSLVDLFGQVYTLDLGQRLGQYITHYRQRWFYQTGFGGYEWRPLPGAEAEITARLKDLALAMRSEDYLELPELLEQNVWVTLPVRARKAYDELEEDLLTRLEEGTVTAKNAAVAAGKCGQVASGGVYHHEVQTDFFDGGNGFGVASGVRKTIHLHDEKTEALLDLVDERQGAPLIVLYDYQHDLERIQRSLPKGTPVLGGGTSDRAALEIIGAWNRGELPVLLGHPGSMGHGLNMQGAGCEHVCFYTLPWDREAYDQVVGRVRRQGTKARKVVVHRLLARDTVDEAKVRSLASKDRSQRAVFDALISLCTQRRRRGT